MKAKRIAAAILTASVGAVSIHAQDQPAKDDAEKKPPEKEVYQWRMFDFGWGFYGLSGSLHKFLHYSTPPDGLFVKDAWFLGTDPSLRDVGYLRFAGQPDDDFRLDGRFSRGFGNTVFEGNLGKAGYYDDTPFPIDESSRRVQEGFLRQKFGGLGFSFRYRMDDQKATYEPPKQGLDQKTRFWDLSGEGMVGGTQVGFGLSNTRYMDYSAIQPFSETERWYATLARQVTPNVALSGAFSNAEISQDGMPGSKVQALSLGGDWDLGPRAALLVNYRQDWLSLPQVLDAYVRRRMAGSAQLVGNLGGWSGRLSYRHREAERVRADHSFVDVPVWDTFEGRLSRKLSDGLRMTLRGSFEELSGHPVMETDDPRSLYWRYRSTAEAKLDRSVGKFSGYGSVSWRDVQNTGRSFEMETIDYLVGGSYELAPTIQAFGEYSLEENRVFGAPADVPAYRSFFPSGRVFSLGLNWTMKPETWWSVGYTDFTTDNDNPLLLPNGNVKGRFFTISLKHRTKSGNEFGLTYAPWRFEDTVASQTDYTTNAIQVTAKVKF